MAAGHYNAAMHHTPRHLPVEPLTPTDDPEAALESAAARLQADSGGPDARARLARRYEIDAPWLGDHGRQALHALYELARVDDTITVAAFVSEHPIESDADLTTLAARHRAAVVNLDGPLPLAPVTIPKPWGREIWYTGIERRGLSCVATATGASPLPWVLSLAPQRFCNGAPITLLKTLDPLPEPVYGDLYLELHDEKQEVYVVTAVDPTAWPDGTGGIRYGIDPAQRRHYGSDAALRDAFLTAIRAYEAVRRDIDARFDAERVRAGIGLRDPVAPALLEQWHAALPAELQRREAALRADMDAFMVVQPLRIGDVVAVPVRVPHSLQHGVRVIEFQTPVYERSIIAFAQKVLTQDHWDSERAVARMRLEAPPAPDFEVVHEQAGCTAERVVSFSDFSVWRASLEARAALPLPRALAYVLCICISGELRIGDIALGPEQACLVPARALQRAMPEVVNAGGPRALCLLAAPNL